MRTRAVALALLLALAGAAWAPARAQAPRARVHPAHRAAVTAGANELVAGAVQPGWPLLVTALLVPGRDSTGARIVPPRPTLSVRVLGPGGGAVALALAPAGPPVEDAAEGTTQWTWVADEAATRALAPGDYRVVVAGTAADSAAMRFSPGAFVVEPAGTGAKEDRRLALLRIERALLLGRPADALASADRMIAADSTDLAAWEARGDLLMAADRPDEAFAAYTRAAGPEFDPRTTPPDLAKKRQRALVRRLEKRGVTL